MFLADDVPLPGPAWAQALVSLLAIVAVAVLKWALGKWEDRKPGPSAKAAEVFDPARQSIEWLQSKVAELEARIRELTDQAQADAAQMARQAEVVRQLRAERRELLERIDRLRSGRHE